MQYDNLSLFYWTNGGFFNVEESPIYKAPDPRALLFLPITSNIYPLTDVNQIALNWKLRTLPTGATYVQVTPCSARNFLTPYAAGTQTFPNMPGFVWSGTRYYEIYKMTFNDLNTAGYVTPFPFSLRKTVADSAVTYDDGSTTDSVMYATVHQIPFSFPYLVFLVETDGTTATGTQSLSVSIS